MIMTEMEHIRSWVNIFKAIGIKEFQTILLAIEIAKEELGIDN